MRAFRFLFWPVLLGAVSFALTWCSVEQLPR